MTSFTTYWTVTKGSIYVQTLCTPSRTRVDVSVSLIRDWYLLGCKDLQFGLLRNNDYAMSKRAYIVSVHHRSKWMGTHKFTVLLDCVFAQWLHLVPVLRDLLNKFIFLSYFIGWDILWTLKDSSDQRRVDCEGAHVDWKFSVMSKPRVGPLNDLALFKAWSFPPGQQDLSQVLSWLKTRAITILDPYSDCPSATSLKTA